MNKRDVIIIAVLVNACLLALLFIFAVNSDDDKIADLKDLSPTVIEIQPAELSFETPEVASPSTAKSKSVITDISLPQTIIIDDDNDEELFPEMLDPQSEQTQSNISVLEDPPIILEPPVTASQYIEVKVKSGDTLEKIAKANNTTIKAIKDANNLKNDKLSIGQVLKVPAGTKPKAKPTEAKAKPTKSESKTVALNEAEYYIVKTGDNPWKIAKQYNLKTDELLKLNNMDENKARNLKPGDKIRVK